MLHHTQLYGLIGEHAPDRGMVEGTPNTPLSTKARAGTKRKSTKSSTSDDEIKKNGKRGRPRVEPQDESAVERRRTQIRLAQRAYRERKETTISALEKRVAQLQQTINEMNQTFLDYHDKVMASGTMSWNSNNAQDLRATVERFLELARKTGSESDAEETEPVFKTDFRPEVRHDQDWISPPARSARSPRGTSSTELTPSMDTTMSMMGYEVMYEEAPAIHSENIQTLSPTHQPKNPDAESQVSDWVNNSMTLQQYHTSIPSPPPSFDPTPSTDGYNPYLDTPLRPTYTYSFQESSFARRLLRASYERTYHLLTRKSTSRAEINRLLRYSLCYGDISTITARLRSVLMRSDKESLEQWSMPVWHVGRAGLHYPRTINESGVPDSWAEPQSMGPVAKNPKAQTWVPDGEFPEGIPHRLGLEGEWFDAHDVEMFLKERGLLLDGHSSVAEVVVDDESPDVPALVRSDLESPQQGSLESFSDPASPTSVGDAGSAPRDLFAMNNNIDYLSGDNNELPAFGVNGGMGVDFDALAGWDGNAKDGGTAAQDLDMGPFAQFGMMLDIAPATTTTTTAAVVSARKRVVTIDVDGLLEALNEKAICLGRSPGYRKDDVEVVLRKVLREAI